MYCCVRARPLGGLAGRLARDCILNNPVGGTDNGVHLPMLIAWKVRDANTRWVPELIVRRATEDVQSALEAGSGGDHTMKSGNWSSFFLQ